MFREKQAPGLALAILLLILVRWFRVPRTFLARVVTSVEDGRRVLGVFGFYFSSGEIFLEWLFVAREQIHGLRTQPPCTRILSVGTACGNLHVTRANGISDEN